MRFRAVAAILSISLMFMSASAQQAPKAGTTPAHGDNETRLGPDDKIQVSVWKEPDMSAAVVVRPDGRISLPMIGELLATGKTPAQLEKEIAQKAAAFINGQPTVNVIVIEVNSTKVSVLGEVRTPGMYRITNKATVLDVLALAGGFTEYAKRDKVTVLRAGTAGDARSYTINVDKIVKKKVDMFYVLPNDKIYVQ
jgi:polysaccharide export outer membrane protein